MQNETQAAFMQKQEKIVRVLEKMQIFLTHGEELGVEIETHLKEKLAFALKESKEAKLRVAIIGGYSEGKTSIAAAWLGREENDMKISNQESSDEVKIYSPDNEVEIVDTPGLFGFKEKQLDSTKIEKYKDITKKYIAKAHLLLYVMNPNNPIKESHKEDLVWLFRDLGLLSRTIFVLGRFDEAADIEDEDEYESAFKIAKDNVIKGLQNAIALTDDELNSLSIVAVAANPFGNGLEYWLRSENIEDFKKLSHIHALQEVTKDLIVKSGGSSGMLQEMQKSIVADTLHNQLPMLVEQSERVAKDSQRLRTSLNDMQRGMSRIEERASQAQISLRTQVTRYFSTLVTKLHGTSMETFAEFYNRDIGDNGVLVETKIQNMFQQELGSIVHDLKNINAKLEEEVGLFEGIVMGYGKQGLDLLRKSGLINSQNVLLARDTLVSAGKMIGLDLAKALKFKPWGAVAFAKNLNIFLSLLTIVFEVWDSFQKAQKEKEFQELKSEIEDDLNAQLQELLTLINGKDSNTTQGFIEQFFPQMLIMQEQYNHIVQAMNEIEGKKQRIEQWREEGEIIDAEFRDID